MNLVVRCLAVVLACALFESHAFAQASSPKEPPRVGLGVSISDVGELLPASSDETLAAAIVPTILIPVRITPWFRVEPEVGGYRNTLTVTNSFGSTSATQTRQFSLFHVGAGAFGVTKKDKVLIYYGGRVAWLRYRQSSQTGSQPESFPYPSIPGWLVAPTIGGEYQLADHFSVGAEVQVKFISWSADSARTSIGGPATSSLSGTSTATHGVLVLRFYL